VEELRRKVKEKRQCLLGQEQFITEDYYHWAKKPRARTKEEIVIFHSAKVLTLSTFFAPSWHQMTFVLAMIEFFSSSALN
jgi:hypothetical protein